MRKNKFGNWENQEAFNILEHSWNKGKSVAVFTLWDDYYIEEGGITVDGFKERTLYKVYTESGKYTELTTFSKLKTLFRNQLIVKIQIEQSPQKWVTKWEDVNYRQKTRMVHNVLIPTVGVKELQRSLSNTGRKLINIGLEPTQKYHRGGSEHASDDCAICMESMKERSKLVARLPCGHNFHRNCIKQDKRDLCPICRTSFSFGKPVSKRISKKQLDADIRYLSR